MTVVQVTIDKKGNSTILVMNIREDLVHDFEYFIGRAKTLSEDSKEQMFLRQRYLRAALLTLFAYAEAVVNHWLHAHDKDSFERLKFKGIDKKIGILHKAAATASGKPKIKSAKGVRNLFVHFTPGRDHEAFEKLTLPLVEKAAKELGEWMTELESRLSLPRHHDSEEIMRAFADVGNVTMEVSSSTAK
jgi:hypothetical protein